MSNNAPTTQQNSREQQIENRIDQDFARAMPLAASGRGNLFVPQTFGEAMEFAKMMAISGPMVGKCFRGNPGACLAISMEAWNHGMDPFPFSRKAYSVGDSIAYEAQLVASIIHTRAPIQGRPSYTYEGEGDKLRCTVACKLIDDPEIKTIRSPEFGKIQPKNSPLWKSDPEQQLGYYTIRNWARRYCPEILLGIYDVDEMEEATRAERARDVTPKHAPSAPQRSDFTGNAKVADADDVQTAANIEDLIATIRTALDEATTRAELAHVWHVAGTDGDLDRIGKADQAALASLSELYNSRAEAFEQEAEKAEDNARTDTGDTAEADGAEQAEQAEPAEDTKAEAESTDAAAEAKSAAPAAPTEEEPRFLRQEDGGVFDGKLEMSVPAEFVRNFQNGGFSILKGYYEWAKSASATSANSDGEYPAETEDEAGESNGDASGADEEADAAQAEKLAETYTLAAIAKVAEFTKGIELNNWFDNTFMEEAGARELSEEQHERVRQARMKRLEEIKQAKAKK